MDLYSLRIERTMMRLAILHCAAALVITPCLTLWGQETGRASLSIDHRYQLLLQEHPEYPRLRIDDADADQLHRRAFDSGAADAARVEALAKIGIFCSPSEVDANRLFELANASDQPDIVRGWAVIAASKALQDSVRARIVEQRLFDCTAQPNWSSEGYAAVLALASCGRSKNAMLREWARLLRDPFTSDDVCEMVGRGLQVATGLYRTLTTDEAVNCLMSGYDERSAPVDRKALIWTQLEQVEWRATLTQPLDEITSRALHRLALREFCNAGNPDELRSAASRCLMRKEPVSDEAFGTAKAILASDQATESLRVAARSIIKRSASQGPHAK